MQTARREIPVRQTLHPATLAGLALALGGAPLLGLLLGAARPSPEGIGRFIQTVVGDWALALILLALVLFWERLPLASIGLRRPAWRDLAWGLLGFLLGALAFALTTPLVQALGLGNTGTGLTRLAGLSIPFRAAIVLTAGITEEILFRGYPIERLAALTGRLRLGAGIAYLVFVLLHLPFWGLGGTVQIGLWSLIITWVYVRRRNLAPCVLMHVLNDAYAFILLPALFPSFFGVG